jgi:hypothetical protein
LAFCLHFSIIFIINKNKAQYYPEGTPKTAPEKRGEQPVMTEKCKSGAELPHICRAAAKTSLMVLGVLLFAAVFCGTAAAETQNAGTFDELVSAINAGNDVKLTGEIVISDTKTLDLKGKTVYAAPDHRLFTVSGKGKFTLKDSVGGGKLTGGKLAGIGGAVYIDEGAQFILESGSITNCEAIGGDFGAGAVGNFGTFTMTGGSIKDCIAVDAGAVLNYGRFVMSGGEITGCKAIDPTGEKGRIGGVANPGTFIMSGGKITGCSATLYVGGVASPGTVTVSGTAEIYGNNAPDHEENLVFDAVSHFTLADDFTGKLYITLSDTEMNEGVKFGTLAKAGIKGADRIFSDYNDLCGSASGTDLILVKKPEQPAEPAETKAAASPAPVLGLIAGLGAVLALRKH